MKRNRQSKPTDPTTPSPNTFRPASYWEDSDPLAAILRNVKGTNRRQMIIDYWNAGQLDELADELLVEDLSPANREYLGRIHPSFMGGEYLPDLLPNEVEIARIELESVTADVISIRARRQPGRQRSHYRVVNEYDMTYVIYPKSSAKPLIHDQLVRLIDTANGGEGGGLGLCYNQLNFESVRDAEHFRHFTTVTSQFYPDLFDHYDTVHERWVVDNTPAPPPEGAEEGEED